MGVNALDIERQNSKFLLSAGADASISLWNLDSTPDRELGFEPTEFVPSPKSHKYAISSISFYPADHGLFITSSFDKTVKAWDTNAMEYVTEFNLEEIVYSAVMAPKSFHTMVAVSSQFPAVRLLDLNTGGNIHSLVGHIGAGTLGINWSPRDEYILASGGTDGTVRLWDIRRAASCLACLDKTNSGSYKVDGKNLAHDGPVNGVSWSEDGAQLVTLGHDDTMRVWRMSTGENIMTKFEAPIRNRRNQTVNPILTPLQISDPQLVFTSSNSSILGFNLNKGVLVKRLKIPRTSTINALVQRPGHPDIYSATTEGKIIAWVPGTQSNQENAAVANEKQNPLDSIYHSLTRTPMTFT
ncbi:WD40 repeat-like protein [Morchella conica CCBAS932]|uniref:WD40 repeat-like protein n=1 Tax=Morchella conica CCBAS932 TaxID=1392247 RepID=A0A3N4KRR5_9PEZI|nr:WD40 repeat-like protein [Morchella conica CCBAS932]